MIRADAGLALRPARPDDADAVAAMCAALARHEGSSAPTMSAERFLAHGFGPSPAFACLIAASGGRPVGYAIHVGDYDTDLMCRSAYVADLFVDVGARRLGVGRALMAAVAGAVAARGGRTLHWNVLRSNPSARAFYRSFGRELSGSVLCGLEGTDLDRLAARPTPAGLELRQATAADVPALSGLLGALLDHEGFAAATLDLPARLADDGFGADPAFRCHLAARDGEVLGYALHWPTYDTEPGVPGVYLSDIYVARAARRGGIARALLAVVARERIAAGARYMEWEVRRENRSARAFYAALAHEYPDVLAMSAAGADFTALLTAPARLRG